MILNWNKILKHFKELISKLRANFESSSKIWVTFYILHLSNILHSRVKSSPLFNKHIQIFKFCSTFQTVFFDLGIEASTRHNYI